MKSREEVIKLVIYNNLGVVGGMNMVTLERLMDEALKADRDQIASGLEFDRYPPTAEEYRLGYNAGLHQAQRRLRED